MKKVLRIILIIAILAGGAYFLFNKTNISPKKDIEETTQTSACGNLKKTLDALPQSIILFGKKLTLKNIDCRKDLIDENEDSYENDAVMFPAQFYYGKGLTARHNNNDNINIGIGKAIDFFRLKGSMETIFMPIWDITNEISISAEQKTYMGTYKIIASIGPTGDAPRNDGKFIISIIGKTGDVIYYTESQQFEVPELSYLITQASNNSLNKFDGNTPKDQKAFNELSAKYKEDAEKKSKDYSKEITLSSMQYISQLIQNNEEYKNFLFNKAEELLKELTIN